MLKTLKSHLSLGALALLSTLLFFAPAKVFVRNTFDIGISLPTALSWSIPAGLLIWLLFVSLNQVLRTKASSHLGLGLLLFSVYFYIQANFLLWGYPRFDGSPIDWSKFNFYGWLELLIFIGLGLLVWLKRESIFKHFNLIVGCLLLAQSVSLLVDSLQDPRIWAPRVERQTNDVAYQFSSSKNIVLVILDGFKGLAFEKALEESPNLKQSFEGFTYYPEHSGVTISTLYSIPTMLSGQIYRNKRIVEDFLHESLGVFGVQRKLKEKGYSYDFVTLGRFCNYLPKASNCSDLRHLADRDSSSRHYRELAHVFDLALFRYLPHVLKKEIFENPSGYFAGFLDPPHGTQFPEESYQYYKNLKENLAVVGSKPRFKLIHLFIPHAPFVYDEQCNWVQDNKNRKNKYLSQVECSLKMLSGIISELKKKNIWEDTAMLVTSDHGIGKVLDPSKEFGHAPIASSLLLVKYFGSDPDFRVNQSFTHISDVPEILIHLNDGSLFRAPKNRERTYFTFSMDSDALWWTDYLPSPKYYEVEGSIFREEAWKP